MTPLEVTLKMIEATGSHGDHEIEEPVSPPACDPEEGPPLLCSQPIEDLAMEVMDENKMLDNIHVEDQRNTSNFRNIPRTIEFKEKTKIPSSFSSLIPATVSDISEAPPASPYKSPPTLHMSGGMVSIGMMASLSTNCISKSTFPPSLADHVCGDSGGAVVEETVGKHSSMLGQDGVIGSYLQYLTRAQQIDLESAKELETNKTKTKKMNDKRSHIPSDPSTCPPSEVSLNLPLDLSVARTPAGNRLGFKRGAGVGLTGRGKRTKEEGSRLNLPIVLKKHFELEHVSGHKMKNSTHINRNLCISKASSNSSTNCRPAIVETENLIEKSEVTKETKEDNFEEVKDVTCKLILPRNKDDNAMIVFDTGFSVEINRNVFGNFEGKLMDWQEQEHSRMRTPSIEHDTTRKVRRKRIISRKQSKKTKLESANIIITKPVESGPNKQATKLEEDKLDAKPKDMPMIVTDGTVTESENHNQNEKEPKMSLKPKLFEEPNFPSPHSPPPSQVKHPGLHKLPSIVRQPSYFAEILRTEKRILKRVK